MQVRKIKPEERLAASKIQSIAFTAGRDFSGAEKDPEGYAKGYETGRAVFNDEGKMCSCFELIPYEVNFDGHFVNMAGIGGVASLPEGRNRGYIRELFRCCFEEMRENKQWFSYLYPFSHIYYRKYGYESCLKKIKYNIPLTSFRHFQDSGEVRHYLPGMDYTAVKSIYDRFIADKNLAVIRNEAAWKRRMEEDPYKNNLYTYVWHNSDGKPESYVTFKALSKSSYNVDMLVQELIWLNGESLLGILGFLKGFSPRYENFIWDTSELFNFNLFFPEPYEVNTELHSTGMNRIVDVRKVLALAKYPSGEGRLSLEVKDNFLNWNNGTFAVNWNENGVEVVKTDGMADLSCSIQSLTQLITGYAGIEELFCQKDVRIYGNYELFSNIFRKKRLFMNDYF